MVKGRHIIVELVVAVRPIRREAQGGNATWKSWPARWNGKSRRTKEHRIQERCPCRMFLISGGKKRRMMKRMAGRKEPKEVSQ